MILEALLCALKPKQHPTKQEAWPSLGFSASAIQTFRPVTLWQPPLHWYMLLVGCVEPKWCHYSSAPISTYHTPFGLRQLLWKRVIECLLPSWV